MQVHVLRAALQTNLLSPKRSLRFQRSVGEKFRPDRGQSKAGQAISAGFDLLRWRLVINPLGPTPEVNISNPVDVNPMNVLVLFNPPTF